MLAFLIQFLHLLLFLIHNQILLAAVALTNPGPPHSAVPPDRHHHPNWTVDYENGLALLAFDFAAAAYSPTPDACLARHDAQLVARVQVPCDALKDECWAFIALSPKWIVFSVRGTHTRTQLVVEIIEAMSEPKKSFPAGGSVQHYFFESLQAIWAADAQFGQKLAQLKAAHPKLPVLFTGHSLGGAVASLASSQFAMENNGTVKPSELVLITFGQPRVGNLAYARAHDRLMPNSFRLIHRFDLVPHLPYCYERPWLPNKCIPLHNHGSFHHGTEIWYPAEDMEPSTSLFRICDGLPFGEDQQCSNAHFSHFSVFDHLAYFGVDVDSYGNHGCSIFRRSSVNTDELELQQLSRAAERQRRRRRKWRRRWGNDSRKMIFKFL